MPLPPRRVPKAFAYITRGDDLLVFRHRDSPLHQTGVQVPAGTVRRGESPESAVIREAVEETGLVSLRLLRFLGCVDYDARPGRDEVHDRSFFHLLAPADTADEWVWFEEHDGCQAPTAFVLWWLPLPEGHLLAADMGALLARIGPR